MMAIVEELKLKKLCNISFKLEYEYGINCPKTRSVDDILESSRNSLSPGWLDHKR